MRLGAPHEMHAREEGLGHATHLLLEVAREQLLLRVALPQVALGDEAGQRRTQRRERGL